MSTRLLPTLDSAQACEVNLNACAAEWLSERGIGGENPLLRPENTQKMIEGLHEKLGVHWSYGSYLEDRSTLLRGSYLDSTGGYIHLGVDINVGAGTPIAAPVHATIANFFDDRDEPQGWGARLILRPSEESLPYIVLGHLSSISHHEGQQISAGEIIAHVGAPPFNGNWFPHLHLQYIARHAIPLHEKDCFRSLDGYGHAKDIETLKSIYPNPTELVLAA